MFKLIINPIVFNLFKKLNLHKKYIIHYLHANRMSIINREELYPDIKPVLINIRYMYINYIILQ